jgi:hypothetical protein
MHVQACREEGGSFGALSPCMPHLRFLKPENPKYQLTEVTHREDFEIWGCVTSK